MDAVCYSRLTSVARQLLDEGRMDIHGRNVRIRQGSRQSEGCAAVPHTEVKHPANGIAARNRIKCAQC